MPREGVEGVFKRLCMCIMNKEQTKSILSSLNFLNYGFKISKINPKIQKVKSTPYNYIHESIK